MSENEINEILCFPGSRKNYAVDFSCVVEISYDFKISKIPCMPPDFDGVCSYKGAMIPVIRIEGEESLPETDSEEESRVIVVIVKHQKYFLGIRLSKEPYIISYTAADKITNPWVWQLLTDGKKKGFTGTTKNYSPSLMWRRRWRVWSSIHDGRLRVNRNL
ncbi:chemotaxis protein CheW [Blautia sp. RD014234]|nr:chemotaxis protein CheW [Blautia parvula]